MMSGVQTRGPLGEERRQLARLLVVPRPLHRLLHPAQVIVCSCGALAAKTTKEPLHRLFGVFTTVNPCRAEEHDGVLDVLHFEAAERLEVLGKYAKGTRLFAVEKVRIEIREWLRRHAAILL